MRRERDADQASGIAAVQRVHVRATLEDGAPAAAAVVRYRPAGTVRREDDAAPDRVGDLETALRGRGAVAVADGHGVAVVDAEPGSDLSVRCGDEYGEARISSDDVRVALRRDVALSVLVVDAEGRPREGFDVEVQVAGESRREGSCDRNACLETDARGMAVLPHAQRKLVMPGRDMVAWRMVLRCNVGAVVERAVTADELLAGKPIRVTAPVGGSVAVAVEAVDDRWIWSWVELQDTVTGESRGLDRSDDGASWFRQLPLGRRWTVHVKAFGESLQQPLAGPVHPDQVVRTRVRLPLRAISLRGRVVRADGVPVPQARVTFAGRSARFFHDNTATSRDGSLGDTIGDFDFAGALPVGVGEIEGATLHVERQPYCQPSTIAIARPLRPGENDLGDVVVPVPADEVVLATVQVRCAGRDVTDTAWAYVCGVGDGQANTVSSFTHREGGVITMRGPRTSRQLFVGCSHPDCLGAEFPIRLGENKVVDLLPAASLALYVRQPPLPDSLLRAVLCDAGGRPETRVCDSDRFQWSRVAPGRHALRILADGRVIHEVPAIDLVAGDNVWPPDGTALDLRHAARAVYLDIRAADGGPVDWPRSYAVPAGDVPPSGEIDVRRLALTEPRWFVPRTQPVDVLATAEGYVPARVANPVADCTVLLQRCTTLHVQTAPGDGVRTIVRVVEDAVRDPWLRLVDGGNQHEPFAIEDAEEPVSLAYAPGTVVEVVVERAGVAGPPRRVAIGASGPIEITAR